MTSIDARALMLNPLTNPATARAIRASLAKIDATVAATATAPKAKPKAQSHRTGQMNKTEAAYSRELDRRIVAGEVAWYRFEPFKLRLGGQTCSYLVDFLVCRPDGRLECHEVKGGRIWEDALIKWKWAADSFDWWRFVLVQKDGARFVVVRDTGERAMGRTR